MSEKLTMRIKEITFFLLLFLLVLSFTSCGADETIQSDGLKYQDLSIGKGKTAEDGNIVQINYQGNFEDGTLFDSSYRSGNPFSCTLGKGELLKGLDEGIVGMKEGGKRKITVPPDLGYGAEGSNIIPPNSTLIFEVELLKVE